MNPIRSTRNSFESNRFHNLCPINIGAFGLYYDLRSSRRGSIFQRPISRPISKAHLKRRDGLTGILWRLSLTGLLLVGGSTCLCGQQAPPVQEPAQNSNAPATATQSAESPTQTPGEIYKEAMHPLEVVRGSLDNWSDAELGALTVGMHKAKDACDAVKPDDYSGGDLYDLARLCALGQDWNAANTTP